MKKTIMKKTIITLFLLLTVVLAACRPGEPAPTETPTLEPSPTLAPVTDTPVPTDTAVPQPTIAPPTVDEAGVLDPAAFDINVGTMFQGWGKNVVQGAPYNPNSPPELNGFPPNLLVNFDAPGEPLPLAGEFNVAIPQGRVFPTAAYRSMFQGLPTNEVDVRLNALQTLLDQRPETFSGPLPVLPGVAGSQALTGRPEYFDFTGGSGVGFLAAYRFDAAPFTDQDLYYFFQGLTSDGQHLLSFVQPLTSTLLPDDGTQLPQETLDAFNIDPAAYTQTLLDSLNSATADQFTPNLDELRAMYRSIRIGAPAGGGPTSPITGPEWQWLRVDGADALQVNDPTRYTLLFLTDGTLQIRADCNRGSGVYTLAGESLQITPGALTRAICPPDSLELEFLNALGQVGSYTIANGQLFLNLTGGGGTMVFTTGLTSAATGTATVAPPAQGTITPTTTGTAAPGEPVIINFNAEPRQINLAACTTLRWDFAPATVKRAELFRETVQIGSQLAASGSLQDCPPSSGRFQYFFEIETEDGRKATRSVVVTVNAPGEGTPLPPTPTDDAVPATPTATATQPIAPPPSPTTADAPNIASFNADSTTLAVGQCVNLSWSFSGTGLTQSLLARGGEVLAQGLQPSGGFQDCPASAGDYQYMLTIVSPAGTDTASVTVTFQ